MRQRNNVLWWLLATVLLLIVFLWPPTGDRSLAVKVVNWAVDPWDELPTMPSHLSMGLGDDPAAVHEHDMQMQQYDALYLEGGWTRRRLELKVARDPYNPATERQLLTVFAVVTALLLLRLNRPKE